MYLVLVKHLCQTMLIRVQDHPIGNLKTNFCFPCLLHKPQPKQLENFNCSHHYKQHINFPMHYTYTF